MKQLSYRRLWIHSQSTLLFLIVLYQCLWLFSETTDGEVTAVTHGSGRYRLIQWVHVDYQVNYRNYHESYLATNEAWPDFSGLKISYLPFAPGISRPAGFQHHIAVACIYFGLESFITGAFFCFPNQFFPRGSRVLFIRRRPFIKFLLGKPYSKKEQRRKIREANYLFGMIEQFIAPAVTGIFIGIFSYPFADSWTPGFIIMAMGCVWGLFRARAWKRRTKKHSAEMLQLDDIPQWSDERMF